jgi:predicted dehydrogenase
MLSPPTKAVGVGGREVRTDPTLYGNVFDHFAIQFEYPNDATVFSLDRQTNGCANHIDDEIIGSKGRASFSYLKTGLTTKDGSRWRFRGDRNNPYQEEHNELIRAIRLGEPINEAKQAAESTLSAIMGREAAYSGQEITWEMAMNARQDFSLPKYDFGPHEIDPVPVPGKYRFQ